MNDHYHLAFIYTCNYITLCLDLVHMVDISENLHGRSWKSNRSNWISKVRNLDNINEKLVYGPTCGKLPAESADM